MNNNPPIRESVARGWTPSWANWFQQVFNCLPWTNAFNVTATLDFPSVPATGQATLTVPLPGARPGDAVTVSVSSDIAGLSFSGYVSANNVVTVVAKNFTPAPIDPGPVVFRIIVIQN